MRNVRPKGYGDSLTRTTAGPPPATPGKIRNIVSFLLSMDAVDELKALQIWKAHELTGDQKGHLEPHRQPQLTDNLCASTKQRSWISISRATTDGR